LKSLIQNGTWDRKEKKIIPLSKTGEFLGLEFAKRLYAEVITKKYLVDWCNSKNASFVIVSLYEEFSKKDPKNEFFQDLKKAKDSLDTADEDNKGLKLLTQLMK